MKMKSAAMAMAMLAGLGTSAGHGNPMTGDGINGAVAREMCKTDRNAAFGFVVGMETARHYLSKMVELSESLASYKEGIKTPMTDLMRGQTCVPDGVPIADRVGLFCKFLDLNHDEDTDKYSAFSAYTEAMKDVWPCN